MAAPYGIQRTRLALITWGHFLNDCYISFFAPVLPLLIAKLSLSLTVASGLASIPSITASVFQPLYGMLSDRIRGRFFILAGPLLSVLGMGLIGIAPNAEVLGALLLCAGIGAAAFHPQAVATAGAVSGQRKGLGISIFIFGGNVGFAVGPLAIIAAVQLWGLDHSYYIVIPGLLSILCLTLVLRVPTGSIERKHLSSLTTAFAGARRPIALLFSIAVIREFTRLSVVTFLPVFLTMQGRSLVMGGVTLSLFSLAGALGGMVGGWLSDTWGRKTIILASALACVPLLYGVFHSSGWLSLVLLVLAAATLMGANSVTIAFAQELVPARASTASSLVMGLGWGVAGVLLIGFGRLADLISVPRALSIVAAVPLLAAACALALPRRATSQGAVATPAPETAAQA